MKNGINLLLSQHEAFIVIKALRISKSDTIQLESSKKKNEMLVREEVKSRIETLLFS